MHASPSAITTKYYVKVNQTVIQNGVIALFNILQEFLAKRIELERMCRVATLLLQSGVSVNNPVFRQLAERCISEQKDDGGWLDVVDTTWCTSFLGAYKEYFQSVELALTWLNKQRHSDGSWGRTQRDIGRIPVTGLILYLLPQLASESCLKWIEKEWMRELETQRGLTYKGAFVLMAFKKNNYYPYNPECIPHTVKWLLEQQNDDSGWGPWKGHPVGSTPFCTGVALIGLLQYPNEIAPKVFQSGIKWLKEKQLPGGLWADHYIEEGSSWAFLAFNKITTCLKGREKILEKIDNKKESL
jgi:squalene cyclase